MESFLKILPTIAAHPLALVGYLAVVIAWLVTTLQFRKAGKLLDSLKNVPEADRLDAIKLAYRATPRAGLSAEQWLRSRRLTFIFAGFAATLFTALVVLAFATFLRSKVDPPTKGGSGPSIETVVGNVYIGYSHLDKEPTESDVGDGQVVLAVEDGRFDHSTRDLALDLRFTIYNNKSEPIKIYNFNTVEYHREQTIFYEGHPRVFLRISPTHAFITEDRTLDISSGGNCSFRLRYEMEVGDGGLEVVAGIVAHYNTPSGKSSKVEVEQVMAYHSDP